jgi:hypothetical protein
MLALGLLQPEMREIQVIQASTVFIFLIRVLVTDSVNIIILRMALAMSKLSGLGGVGSHASSDPQDKIVRVFSLIVLCSSLFIHVLQVPLAMARASKLFDKKNGGASGSAGGTINQAAKVQGSSIHLLDHSPSFRIGLTDALFTYCSHALRCSHGNASMGPIQDD